MKIRKLTDNPDPFWVSLNAVPICRRRIADTDWFPAVDVSDLSSEYLYEFDLPGLTREEIQISLEGSTLSKSFRSERPCGAFVRRLVLPADACADEVRATIRNGILELHVSRTASAREDLNIVPFQKANHEHAIA